MAAVFERVADEVRGQQEQPALIKPAGATLAPLMAGFIADRERALTGAALPVGGVSVVL